MKSSLAPIVLFVYNRPWHTQQTLHALAENKLAEKSILYIYADGPKENLNLEELNKIEETRKLIRSKKWCKEVHIIEKEQNIGLADSIIEGVTKIVNEYGRIIVLEDDIVTSPFFIEYCNEGLEMYQNNNNVYSINAYQFDLNIDKIDTFLCPLATSSWGWATWANKWEAFERNSNEKIIIQNHALIRKRFNISDYDYATMLDNKKSWAIWWYYSVFLRNGVGLFTTKSLVNNIGFDGSGENCGTLDLNQYVYQKKINLEEKKEIDLEFYSKLLDYFTLKNTPVYSKSTPLKFSFYILIKKIIKKIIPNTILNIILKIKNN